MYVPSNRKERKTWLKRRMEATQLQEQEGLTKFGSGWNKNPDLIWNTPWFERLEKTLEHLQITPDDVSDSGIGPQGYYYELVYQPKKSCYTLILPVKDWDFHLPAMILLRATTPLALGKAILNAGFKHLAPHVAVHADKLGPSFKGAS